MNTAIFHTVNAGLYFWDGSSGILIDGLHRGQAEGFSDLPDTLQLQLEEQAGMFAHLHGLFFTHDHPDHYDAAAEQLCAARGIPLYVPGHNSPLGNAHPILPDVLRYRLGQAYIIGRFNTHDGPAFQTVPHCSYLVRMTGERFLVAGDAHLQEEDAVFYQGCHDAPVAGVFLNIYQAFAPDTHAFLRRLAPQRIFLYHLPFPQDDHNNFYSLARCAAERFPPDLSPLEQLPQMGWVDGIEAGWTHLENFAS